MRKHKKLRVKMAPLELSDEGRKPPRDDSSSPRVDESRGKVRAIPPLLDPARGVSLFRRVTLPDSLGAADLVSLRDIPPRIEMAPWRGRIEPSGITTIGGTPGAGAFEVACSAAAMVSNGALLPHGEGRAADGNVVIVTAKDNVAEEIQPRLEAAAVDPTRVFIVRGVREQGRTRQFELPSDLDHLETAIRFIRDVRLVILWRIGTLPSRHPRRKRAENPDISRAIWQLRDVAKRYGMAVVAIVEFAEAEQARAITWGDFHPFVDASSSALVVRREEGRDRRKLVQLKGLGDSQVAELEFELNRKITRGGIVTPTVVWDSNPVSASVQSSRASRRSRKRRKRAAGNAPHGEPPAADGDVSLTKAIKNPGRHSRQGELPKDDARKQARDAGIGEHARASRAGPCGRPS